jgi:hypothetical protein
VAGEAARWLVPAVGAVLAVVAVTAGLRYRESRSAAAETARARAVAEVSPASGPAPSADWGDSYEETFEFEVAGGELSGAASYLRRPRILDGKLEGSRVSFTTKSLTSLNDKTFEDTHHYRGTVGERHYFTLSTDSGAESHVPVRFTVRR